MKKLITTIVFVMATIIGVAQTIGEAFYIFRNDGEINGFLRSEVDSIVYSYYDADSILYDEIVSQIVYTNDSVFWIPLAAVDSVSFVSPKTTYQPGVINLSENIMPYIIGCSSLTISLSSSTPTNLIPKVGDKLVTTEMNEIFPIGFAGEVIEVKGSEIICKSVLLEEVFETYYNVASVYGYVEEEQSSIKRLKTGLKPIDKEWDKNFELNTITLPYNVEISRAVKPNSDLALKGGSGYSIELTPSVHVRVLLIINNVEGTYFKGSVQGNLNVTEKLSIYGGLELSHDFPRKELRVERPICPYVTFFFEPGLFIRGNVLASASLTASQDYTFGWIRDWSSRGRNVIKPSAGGRQTGSSLDIEGCVDGSVSAGGYVDMGLALIHSALDNISLRGEIGAEFVGNAMLYNNDIENAKKSTELYERFKQSSFELNAFVNTACNLQLVGGIWGVSYPLPWNLSVNINKWDVVPSFADVKFKQKRNDATQADASASVLGKCLFPVQVGFSMCDEYNEEIESYWDGSFRNTSKTMSETFSGLSSTGEYTLYPKVKALGINMLASPSKKLEKAEMPVEITGFKQTRAEYEENGFNYNGFYYNYKYSCSVTVNLKNSENIEDWGYIYEDPNGNISRISLKNFSTPYTDTRYVYYRNESQSTVRLYEYVKYKEESEYYYGEAYNYPVEYFCNICPDENHPHMIDLGLPSGTKWACCNVGASKPEEYGGYYAWGETCTKDQYTYNTYHLRNGNAYAYVGDDIANSQYDAANINWGEPWCMPTIGQFQELVNNTTSIITSYNGIAGRSFTGKNGCAIFLPYAGGMRSDDLGKAGREGFYWSSTFCSYGEGNYTASMFQLKNAECQYVGDRGEGNSIRPVQK